MRGFIKLSRNILKWEWYKDSNTKAVWLHCLLMAARESYIIIFREMKVLQCRKLKKSSD